MKSIIIFIFIFNTFIHSESKNNLNLNDAINISLKNNIRLLEAEQNLIIAKQKIREARLMFLPQIYFSGDIINSNIEKPTIIGEQHNYRYISEEYDDKYLYGIKGNLIQPLYTGGRLKGNLELSKAEYNQKKAKYEEIKLETIYKIKKAFYSAVFYKNLLNDLEESYQKIKNLFEKINENDEYYLESLQIEMDIKQELIELKNKYENSKMELIKEMNTQFNFDFEINTQLLPIDIKDLDIKKCIIAALENRAELKNELYQLQMDNIYTDIAITRKYPEVYLGLSYDAFSNNLSSLKKPSTRNENFIYYIGIQYPFPYNFWLNIQKEKAKEKESELRKIRLEDEIKFKVIQAYQNYITYSKKLKEYSEKKESINNLFNSALKSDNKKTKIKTFEYYYKFKKDFFTAIYNQINSLIELEKERGQEIIK